jgi:hypothetical protein
MKAPVEIHPRRRTPDPAVVVGAVDFLTGAASSYGTSEEGAKDAAPLRRAGGAARLRETAEAA